ncbi:hypothetical protein ABR738_01305 [Streptomyces sp. Edi4]|uniref:hypothetical protein n=1 Tax=Streptomyces sp. Edi4 TaxID=3162527 RepID=UPI003305B4DE
MSAHQDAAVRPEQTAAWDQAEFRCGRCGAVRTATTPDAYTKTIAAHRDAHLVLDRLNPIERDGLVSILRTVLAAPELGTEVLAVVDAPPQPI